MGRRIYAFSQRLIVEAPWIVSFITIFMIRLLVRARNVLKPRQAGSTYFFDRAMCVVSNCLPVITLQFSNSTICLRWSSDGWCTRRRALASISVHHLIFQVGTQLFRYDADAIPLFHFTSRIWWVFLKSFEWTVSVTDLLHITHMVYSFSTVPHFYGHFSFHCRDCLNPASYIEAGTDILTKAMIV